MPWLHWLCCKTAVLIYIPYNVMELITYLCHAVSQLILVKGLTISSGLDVMVSIHNDQNNPSFRIYFSPYHDSEFHKLVYGGHVQTGCITLHAHLFNVLSHMLAHHQFIWSVYRQEWHMCFWFLLSCGNNCRFGPKTILPHNEICSTLLKSIPNQSL